jgi:uncharacterized membrane protein HdeD (DUF308 family)
MSMPETRAGAVSRDAIRGLASSWWLFLILGILWILFGMFVLSYNVGSLLALAVFAGVTFVMTGITQVLAAGRADSWKWLYLIGGALSIIAGILAFVWPGRTLLVLAGSWPGSWSSRASSTWSGRWRASAATGGGSA